jgi:diguanylate cyclase (GGDEF)-like protein/PAS domain S-box-containing protein
LLQSSVVIWLILSALLAAGLIAALIWKRRQELAVAELSKELLQYSRESASIGRLGVQEGKGSLTELSGAVNRLLEKLEQRGLKLQEREQLFQKLVETVHDAILVTRESILFANTRFLGLLGVSAKELIGRPLADYVAPEYIELVRENFRRRLAGEPAAERYEAELVGAHGQVTRVELGSMLIDSAGEPALLVSAVEMLPAAVTSPAPSRPRSMLTLDAMNEAVFTVDAEGRIDYLNIAAESLIGLRADQMLGKMFNDVASLVDEQDRRSLGDPVRKCLQTGTRPSLGRRVILIPVQGGAEHSIELSISPVRETAAVSGAVLVMHDTSELRGIARQMSYQASHDALTGLVNRREFERRLSEAMELAQSGEGAHALCYLDLDRFKIVNDSVGHMAGDNMLREVASIIKDRVRDSDTVARIGGDEFALLLMGCPLDKARQISDDVVRAVADYRFVWKDKIFDVGVSIGLVEVGREASAYEDIMNAADSACYIAKKQGGTHVHVYSAREEATARHSGEIEWLQKLQTALRDNKFELYYQSIVPAQRGGLRGPALEVLVRLNEPGGPEVSPIELIRAAERYRLMPHIDRWVVQTVLSALGRGGLKLPPGRSIAINIASQTLGDGHFLEFAVDCFDHTGAAPSDVCFEVTESSVTANLEHARRFIEVLHGMGCEFALDNFGSGLGSFANLKNLPMDYLKIDGSFIRNLAQDAVNQAMVAAMVKLSRSMNFKVVAEQVEDQQSLDAAQSMGIDFLQGFAIGRPQPLTMAP